MMEVGCPGTASLDNVTVHLIHNQGIGSYSLVNVTDHLIQNQGIGNYSQNL